MTLESANICQHCSLSGLVRPRCSREPGSHRILRQPSAEKWQDFSRKPTDCHLRTIATNIAMCSFLYRNTFYWELAFGVGSSERDPKLGEKEMDSTKAEKCAHPLCSCVATSGKYCSAECQATEKTPEIACACPHAGCKGKTH